MAGTTTQETSHALTAEHAERIDGYVARARVAADAFRAIDDQATRRPDRLRARRRGPRARRRARPLAMEETGFGVFEDKVVKNYIATEFLSDYLKDKRSVGVIEEDAARAVSLRRGADRRRARADADHEPDLDGAVQGDRRRQDPQRDDLPALGPRRPLRAAGDRDPAGGRRARRAAAGHAAGDPRPDARRLAVPLPPPRRRLHLDDRRPEGGRRRQRGRQALPQRRSRQRARSTSTAAPTSGWRSSTC